MNRGMGAFDWGNLLGSVVGNIVNQTSKPPAVTPPAVAPPAAATPAVTASTAVAAQEKSALQKYWPIMAVGGLGIVAVGAVLVLKKKSA